ncbi:hypothetical protein BJY04DRAFT_179421 [Aspergillus karnatakaensis]|uniref:uncharacterized protein n=1 Tax=Aspergillus karnatakaensis TaxID=1810916 RepID=UPI003CCDB265
MAPRPDFYPVPVPQHITFPSELQEYLRAKSNPTSTSHAEDKASPVTPPLAYTEFLKALSPKYGSPPSSASSTCSDYLSRKQLSPRSLPLTASAAAFPSGAVSARRARTHTSPRSPMMMPRSAGEPNQYRRLRMSPSYLYSPALIVESPRNPRPSQSSYPSMERRVRYVESTSSPTGTITTTTTRSITIQHVVTHTNSLKRVPSLAPAPKGKRRRVSQTKQ